MSQNVHVTRPRHRRTRSLDSTDSLERLEARQQYRQQFLAIRAKFNNDQALPSTHKPRAVRSLPPASQNREDNAGSLEISNAKLLLFLQLMKLTLGVHYLIPRKHHLSLQVKSLMQKQYLSQMRSHVLSHQLVESFKGSHLKL